MKTNIISKELVRIMFDIKASGEITVNLDEKNELSVHVLGWGTMTKNVYEITNSCKMWASKQGYCINSSISKEDGYRWVLEIEPYHSIVEIPSSLMAFSFDAEYESIFKTCEWILKEEEEAK